MRAGQTFEEANPVHPYRATKPHNPGQRAVVGHLVRPAAVDAQQPGYLRDAQEALVLQKTSFRSMPFYARSIPARTGQVVPSNCRLFLSFGECPSGNLDAKVWASRIGVEAAAQARAELDVRLGLLQTGVGRSVDAYPLSDAIPVQFFMA